MVKLDATCREVLEKSEWVAIATAGPDGPHVVGTWGDYVVRLGIDGEVLRVPIGGMRRTEDNLRHDPRVELLHGAGDLHRRAPCQGGAQQPLHL